MAIDLSRLSPVGKDGKLPNNAIGFTLSTDPTEVFYVPQAATRTESEEKPKKSGETVRGIVERSLRETRMKQGIGVGGLHQHAQFSWTSNHR